MLKVKKEAQRKTGKVTIKSIPILTLLKDNPQGLKADTISKLTNTKARTLYNRLSRLRDLGLVKNIFPIWKIANIQALSPDFTNLLKSNKDIQAHKFSFKLILIKKPDWWERRNNRIMNLKSYHIQNVTWGNNPYQQIFMDNFIVQTFSKSIILINQKKYYGVDPYECFISALEDTLNIVKFLEERFNFKFYLDGIPHLAVRSHHYVKLNDDIANRCKKSRNMLQVIIKGNLRALVDLSDPFGMEFVHKNYNVDDTSQYQKLVTDVIENNPPMLSELSERHNKLLLAVENQLGVVKGIQENQLGFAKTMVHLDKNVKTHFKVLRGIEKAIVNHGKAKAIHKIREDYQQRKLGEFT